MLKNKASQIWTSKPKLSAVFWLFTALGYGTGILAIISITFGDYTFLESSGETGERLAFHVGVVRLIFITLALLVFPVLLLTSLRRLFYFLVGITAWVLIIYIDDVLVLYTIMKHPQTATVSIVFAVRPFVIIGLFWMCFELNLRLRNGS